MKNFLSRIFRVFGCLFAPTFDDSELMELIEKNRKVKIPTIRETWESVWEYFTPYLGK